MTYERSTTLDAKRKLGYDAPEMMQGPLNSSDFYFADRYSISDISLYAHVAEEGQFDLCRFPVRLDRVKAQPDHVPIPRVDRTTRFSSASYPEERRVRYGHRAT